MAETLREHLEGHDCTTVLNDDGVGTVTVFQGSIPTAWTPGRSEKDRERTDTVPLRGTSCCATTTTTAGCSGIYTSGRCAAKPSASPVTDCYRETDYGEPMVGLKSFILSLFIDERDVEQLVRDILDARQLPGRRHARVRAGCRVRDAA